MKSIFSILVFTLISSITSCVTKIPIPESKLDYIGTWYKSDGSWLSISANGRGDFDMPNSNVSGGAVTLTDEKITIEILGIKSNWTIVEEPYQEDGFWLMNLTGNIYEKY